MTPARLGQLIVVVVGAAASLYRGAITPPRSSYEVHEPRPAISDGSGIRVLGDALSVSSGATPRVHSVSAVELADGRLFAVWYGGTREGARDVSIYSAYFDPRTESWSDERVVISREDTERTVARSVRKLGNPVVFREPKRDGRLWLFYVSVSIGGWSGSAVNVMTSEDEGRSFGPPRRLVTSPFMNVATLVKGAAVPYADGTIALPVYQEFLGKFGEVLRLDQSGQVIEKARLSWGRGLLQPVVVPLDPERAIAFLRRSGRAPRRVHVSRTDDSGASWSPPVPSPLANPDAAVFGLHATSGNLFLAFNDSETNRENLSLAVSTDGGMTWEIAHVFEPPRDAVNAVSSEARFGYPWLVESRAEPGRFHLLCTWNRTNIVHVRFEEASSGESR
jgi:predicted neuraminidase